MTATSTAVVPASPARTLKFKESGLHLILHITAEKDVRLVHFGTAAFDPTELLKDNGKARWYRLVEVQISGANMDDHHGMKYTATYPGSHLKFVNLRDTRNEMGRKLEVEQKSPEGLTVISHIQFYKKVPVMRSWTTLRNDSAGTISIDYVSSFSLTGLTKESKEPWDKVSRLHIPHNCWDGEIQWRSHTLPELGLTKVAHASTKRLSFETRGTWGSDGYLPMGVFENTEANTCLFFQIEHHGSWQWEVSDNQNAQLYVKLSGPTFNEAHWMKLLKPKEVFDSIPVAVGIVEGTAGIAGSALENAMQQLTVYRRRTRRPNEDNEKLPVIFNDYMNCLFGNPTSANLPPLIDAAAKAGCEYFCIDCGWYADGFWWFGVGEWLPSAKRFPGPTGIKEPLDYIRSRGMVPGLWLELEVMGTACPMVQRVDKDWFFQRNGVPVVDHGRYQLDYRNPDVIKHADGVIKRLVEEYGVGYIKMDYNINAGVGTSLNSDSLGDGLLRHQDAYLQWLDRVFVKYPNLVIENCGSGGLRMTYSLLSRHSIQSTSDQTDYRKYAPIAAAAPTAATPEQQAVWSYPLRDGSAEETIFNMVNALLLRIHQSGHLAEISAERVGLVTEGIKYYKQIRKDLPTALPFWPLGMPTFQDGWACLGMRSKRKDYLAVWRLDGAATTALPIPARKGEKRSVKIGYPVKRPGKATWNARSGVLSVTLPEKFTARLMELS